MPETAAQSPRAARNGEESHLASNPPGPSEHPAAESEVKGLPFLDRLGVRLLPASTGTGRLTMTVGPHHMRNLGIMHGGVLATLLDSVMGMAAGSTAPEAHFVVTVQLNINFTRPAWEGETLVASAEVQHSGKLTVVARGEVRTEAGILVGTGTATFLYLPHTDPAGQRFERVPDANITGSGG